MDVIKIVTVKLPKTFLQVIKSGARVFLKAKSYAVKHKKLSLSVGSVLFAVILIFGFSESKNKKYDISPKTHQIKHKGSYLNQQLDEISSKLSHIEQNISQKNSVVDLDSIRTALSDVTQQTQELTAKSYQIITHQIQSSNSDLKKRLADIKQQLQKLAVGQKLNVYLKPDSLPFEVEHIDNIEQQDVVTVFYDHGVAPLNIGDSLAGWKLIRAEFASQKVEFVNAKQQHVVVDLNQADKKRGK